MTRDKLKEWFKTTFLMECFPRLIDDIMEEVDKYVKSEKEKIRIAFIQKFCNDHNEEIRWLRNASFNKNTLLDEILEIFDAEINNKNRCKYCKKENICNLNETGVDYINDNSVIIGCSINFEKKES